ncbi:MAG: glycerol-3-phosphate dehydrogenase/oxidase [Ardenticatenaceae bacterium]|nr:glycerol-3-phosphate dehydrogenase/oxidase [Ardenticatenaceae bacterium]
MWTQNWRTKIWQNLDQDWDIVIVGGGITGAGILREAVRLGLRVLLVEQRDFAWGTSSRSSKLVHGGFRYLKEGKLGLTMASVQEREQLLAEGPGLIDPLGFLLATYEGDKMGRMVYEAGLTVYDLLALQWSHEYYSPADFRMMAPHLTGSGLKGGFRYGDALTDDARLTLRVIREAVADGGTAVNYVKAIKLLQDETGQVTGIRLQDHETTQTKDVPARLVINATGAWADKLRGQVGGEEKIRPLRGSHLIFPSWRLPVAQAVSFLHPLDQRPVFIFPWEGITLIGTTDADHKTALDEEPGITPDEVAYLMAAIESQFPSLGITLADVTASFAGVRPVIGSGKADPSEESRDHVVWEENGLLTVTGGKLTTFRLIALDVLKAARHHFPDLPELDDKQPVLKQVTSELPGQLDKFTQRRLLGRYGQDAATLLAAAQPDELSPIADTPYLWAELRWAARAEGVIHLDDLLLRRVRLGLLLPEGGAGYLARIRTICQPELGWDNAKWEAEAAAYQALWLRSYSLPEDVPDWRVMLAQREELEPMPPRFPAKPVILPGVLTLMALVLALLWWRRRKDTYSCRGFQRSITKLPGS